MPVGNSDVGIGKSYFPLHRRPLLGRITNSSPSAGLCYSSRSFYFGLLPACLLLYGRATGKRGRLMTGAALTCGGVLLNRLVLTIQTLALPTLAFDDFPRYLPSWQEVATFGGVIAYGMIVYSWSYRYLPLFGKENQTE